MIVTLSSPSGDKMLGWLMEWRWPSRVSICCRYDNIWVSKFSTSRWKYLEKCNLEIIYFPIYRPFDMFYTLCRNVLHFLFILLINHSFTITYSLKSTVCRKICPLPPSFFFILFAIIVSMEIFKGAYLIHTFTYRFQHINLAKYKSNWVKWN